MNSFSPIFPLQNMERFDNKALGVSGQMWMPARNPLDMPTQDFRHAFRDKRAKDRATPHSIWSRRIATLGPALILTCTVIYWLGTLLGSDGLAVLELIWLGLIFSTFTWISITFASAGAGLFAALRPSSQGTLIAGVPALKVAILSPIYNESPTHVFGNLAAMAAQLANVPSHHSYTFFLLSDTQDPFIAALEEEAMLHLRANMTADFPIYYRRRTLNTDRKTGNLAHWLRNWGGAFDAMLVFDADSIMSAKGVLSVTNALASDRSLGLVQTCPRLFGSDTFFGRMQQFSSAAFGLLPALGEAFWSYREANYHGHNAIVRTEAFATCAGLPYLKDRKGKETPIFSHDFVEAALLRRAGWGVKMVPTLNPTFEETPTTLIDYILRDRRWCQGNMQHLRIMWGAGLHPVSRFHLGINALTYLMSPLWFALVIIGATLGTANGGGVLAGLTGQPASNFINFALFQSQGLWLIGVVYLMLIAPKIAGFIKGMASERAMRNFAGRRVFTFGFLVELISSMAVAPILMIQQTRAIVGILIGRHENWNPQKRYEARYDFKTMMRFHKVETTIGAFLMIGILSSVVSVWLLPIAISLLGASVLSVLSGMKFASAKHDLFTTPFEMDVPPIISQAQVHQDIIANSPELLLPPRLAAE